MYTIETSMPQVTSQLWVYDWIALNLGYVEESRRHYSSKGAGVEILGY